MKTWKLIFSLLLLFVFSCQRNKKIQEQDLSKETQEVESNTVDVIILHKKNFYKELVSNGKLAAEQKMVMHFETSGKLHKIYKHNGQYVGKGQIIAQLDTKTAQENLQAARLALQSATIARDEQLIGQGYLLSKIDSIPKEVLNVASLRSGYSAALLKMQIANDEAKKLLLRAPFSGKVADITKKIYENISPSDNFCTLIDDRKFYVEFSILENEIQDIKLGDRVEVGPFSLKKEYKGKITEINPEVDNNGMIKVKALVFNTDKKLLEGMNVEIRIRRAIPNQLVVPKQAVVIRDNLDVLFRYTHGIAYWTYIKIVGENSDSYAVIANQDRSATLNAGDTVIVSDNLNLAHKSKVKINKILSH